MTRKFHFLEPLRKKDFSLQLDQAPVHCSLITVFSIKWNIKNKDNGTGFCIGFTLHFTTVLKGEAQLFDTSSLEKREKMSFWKVFDRITCLFISFISLRSLIPTWYNLYSVKNQKVSAITFSSVKPSNNRTHECLFKRSGSTLDEEAVVLNGKHCLGPLLAKCQMQKWFHLKLFPSKVGISSSSKPLTVTDV